MVQGLYALWMARNNTREGTRIEEPGDMAIMVRRLMEEWQQVNGKESKASRAPLIQNWSVPDEGWIKANVDGATAAGGKGAGGGFPKCGRSVHSSRMQVLPYWW